MAEHELKTWPSFFAAVLDGRKTFEARRADRDFEMGDVLVLREWDPAGVGSLSHTPIGYTGRELRARVTYILRGGNGFGVEAGHVVMGIRIETQPSGVAP